MELFNFTYEDQHNSKLTNHTSPNRSFSMPHHLTTATHYDDNNNHGHSSRRSTDMDRLYNAYLGGHVHGTHLLDVPDWHYEEKSSRCGSTNNESWCNHAFEEATKGFRLDPVTGQVALKGSSCSSKNTCRTDKVTGLTTRVRSMSMSDESSFYQDLKRKKKKKKMEMKKKKKKSRRSVWSTLFSFGCS